MVVFIGIPFDFGNCRTMVKAFNGNEIYLVVALFVPPMRHFGDTFHFTIKLTEIFFKH